MIERDPRDEFEDEFHFLRWFYDHADFGPADGDVRYYLKQEYMEKTGRMVPSNYVDSEE